MSNKELNKKFLEANNKLFEFLSIRKNLFEELGEYPLWRRIQRKKIYTEKDDEKLKLLFQKRIMGINKKIEAQRSIIQKIVREAEKNKIEIPFVNICNTYKLNDLEKDIIVILFFSAFDNGPRDGMLAGELLSFLFCDRVNVILNKNIFYENSTLRKSGLIKIEGYGDTLLNTRFMLTERTLREIAGDTENLEDNDLREFDNLTERWTLRRTFKSNVLQVKQPVISFDKVILDDEKRNSIEKALWQLKDSNRIFEDWGFNETIFYGTTVSMLFYGPPGTGKTMTAEAIAHKLHKKLGIANYADIISCWVGESEKHIVKIFDEAKKENCVLVFDEADALFSKRLDAEHSVDMTNNRMVNILLQQLEKFEGVVILTSNREVAFDKALDRRISLRLKFDMPSSEERAKIWASFFTERAPLAEDVDFKKLGEEFAMSGGYIKNAVLNAVREYAFNNKEGKETKITMEMLERSAKNEMESLLGRRQKIGF